MLKEIIKTFKVKHYIKNAVVIIPLVFSLNYSNLNSILHSFLIFIAFCLISSAVYILNDLIDIKNDRQHPLKRERPIASGKISKSFAIVLLLFLLLISSFIGIKLNYGCILMIASYFILNTFYSLFLKNIALIDVACIAIGFVFRIIAGCFAINVLPSPLVILMMFFGSMFFTFTKRKLELQLIKENEMCRKSIRGFDINTINQFILLNAIMLISFYLTYMLDKTTIEKAGTQYLYITVIPFTLIIFRLLFLINIVQEHDDPIYLIEKDNTIKILCIFYLITLFIILIL